MMNYYYVYILECVDKSYYVGVTNDLSRRLAEHSNGLLPKAFTKGRRPVKLVYTENFIDIRQAIAREKQIKKWSRVKKEALIKGLEETLPQLSIADRDKK